MQKHLATGEAIKDPIETETILLTLKAEAAILKGVESVWYPSTIRFVHLVSTASYSGLPE